MHTPAKLFIVTVLGLCAALGPWTAAQAGFSISYSSSGGPRQHARRGHPPLYTPGYYQNRYGRRFRHGPRFYYDRFGNRYRHHRRLARRRNCDVIIVRPRYGRPYVLERYCPFPAVRAYRRIPGSHR